MKAIVPLLFTDSAAWRAWLAENHDKVKEAWVIHQKARSETPGLRYDAALVEALAFGWIDGMMRSLDKNRIMQRYTPRRSGSNWSEANKTRVLKLISSGKIAGPGLAAVEAAKKSGKW